MPPFVAAISPLQAIEGGRITLEGSDFPVDGPHPPEVRIGGARGRVAFASSSRIVAIVPSGIEGGRTTVRVAGAESQPAFVDVASPFATALPQVDSPVFDRDGNAYLPFLVP